MSNLLASPLARRVRRHNQMTTLFRAPQDGRSAVRNMHRTTPVPSAALDTTWDATLVPTVVAQLAPQVDVDQGDSAQLAPEIHAAPTRWPQSLAQTTGRLIQPIQRFRDRLLSRSPASGQQAAEHDVPIGLAQVSAAPVTSSSTSSSSPLELSMDTGLSASIQQSQVEIPQRPNSQTDGLPSASPIPDLASPLKQHQAEQRQDEQEGTKSRDGWPTVQAQLVAESEPTKIQAARTAASTARIEPPPSPPRQEIPVQLSDKQSEGHSLDDDLESKPLESSEPEIGTTSEPDSMSEVERTDRRLSAILQAHQQKNLSPDASPLQLERVSPSTPSEAAPSTVDQTTETAELSGMAEEKPLLQRLPETQLTGSVPPPTVQAARETQTTNSGIVDSVDSDRTNLQSPINGPEATTAPSHRIAPSDQPIQESTTDPESGTSISDMDQSPNSLVTDEENLLADELESSTTGRGAEESAFVQTDNQDTEQHLPLETVWPVQRFHSEGLTKDANLEDDTKSQIETSSADAPSVEARNEAKAINQAVQTFLDSVPTAQATESAIHVVTPRRPRPSRPPIRPEVDAGMEPPATETIEEHSETTDSSRATPSNSMLPLSEDNSSLVQKQADRGVEEQQPTVDTRTVESVDDTRSGTMNQDSERSIQAKMIDTEIGAMPRDLWSLIDESPPHAEPESSLSTRPESSSDESQRLDEGKDSSPLTERGTPTAESISEFENHPSLDATSSAPLSLTAPTVAHENRAAEHSDTTSTLPRADVANSAGELAQQTTTEAQPTAIQTSTFQSANVPQAVQPHARASELLLQRLRQNSEHKTVDEGKSSARENVPSLVSALPPSGHPSISSPVAEPMIQMMQDETKEPVDVEPVDVESIDVEAGIDDDSQLDSNGSNSSGTDSNEMSLEQINELAQQIYPQLKRQLINEWERLRYA